MNNQKIIKWAKTYHVLAIFDVVASTKDEASDLIASELGWIQDKNVSYRWELIEHEPPQTETEEKPVSA